MQKNWQISRRWLKLDVAASRFFSTAERTVQVDHSMTVKVCPRLHFDM